VALGRGKQVRSVQELALVPVLTMGSPSDLLANRPGYVGQPLIQQSTIL